MAGKHYSRASEYVCVYVCVHMNRQEDLYRGQQTPADTFNQGFFPL